MSTISYQSGLGPPGGPRRRAFETFIEITVYLVIALMIVLPALLATLSEPLP